MIDTTDDIQTDELELLKQRADTMGLRYHPNISVEKLREKIAKALSDEPGEAEAKEPQGTASKEKRRQQSIEAATKLRRVRVTCMDQSKAHLQGVLITTGNSSTGTVRKFVMFDVDYHIPEMIYNVMKETKMQIFTSRKDNKGNLITESKLVNAYAIEDLPPLTEAELKDLAQRQAMASGTQE